MHIFISSSFRIPAQSVEAVQLFIPMQKKMWPLLTLRATTMQVLSNNLTSDVTNVYDMDESNRIVVQTNDKLWDFNYNAWSSFTITGPVIKVVAAAAQ